MQIGNFIRTANGYEGMIETATLDLRISLVPAEPNDADKAPDWRVHRGSDAEGPEIGAGWNETGERAGDYVSLRIDDPAFAQPLRAALFRNEADNSSWVLRWNRRNRAANRTEPVRMRRHSFAILLLTSLVAPGPAVAQEEPASGVAASHPYAGHVAEAAHRFGIPEAWIWAVMRVESAGSSTAVSHSGAMGLMQIMPGTWAQLRARHRLGSDPFDPRANIMAGAAYLRAMYDRYGNVTAMLAAYNAGLGRYDQYLSRGRPLPAETRAYLTRLASISGYSSAVQVAAAPPADPHVWRRAGLFVRTASAVDVRSETHSSVPLAAADSAADPHPERVPPARIEATGPQTPAPMDTLFVPRAGAGRPQ